MVNGIDQRFVDAQIVCIGLDVLPFPILVILHVDIDDVVCRLLDFNVFALGIVDQHLAFGRC